jgi:hypothetical protein
VTNTEFLKSFFKFQFLKNQTLSHRRHFKALKCSSKIRTKGWLNTVSLLIKSVCINFYEFLYNFYFCTTYRDLAIFPGSHLDWAQENTNTGEGEEFEDDEEDESDFDAQEECKRRQSTVGII